MKENKTFEAFKEKTLSKIDNGEPFSESELQEWFDWFAEVDEIREEKDRWTQPITTIFKIDNRYFQLDWDEGLTEYQPNEFYSQPFEVEKKEYEKVITVVDWVKKGEKND